ncbi:NAD(P)-dependent oxidoreductase [Gryllotalpicola reticulitermitis]|uniref:NAD(P)-dependent oxidoreductase n=1 Tax=Gryllotalpicola reticulitermitis TaxID=1184153 RepID=A0ABV8Q3D1_9MICO
MTVITSLSPYSEEQVKRFAGTVDVEVRLVPDPPDPSAVRAAIVGADVIIGDIRAKHRLGRDELALVGPCRLIQQPAVGFDSIDADAAAEFGIPVANAGGYNSDSVADWVLMAILNLLRNGSARDRSMHAGEWSRQFERAHELSAVTVGIVGAGNIGRAVARRLNGFGSTVLYYDPVVSAALPGAASVSLDELFSRSDVVTVHAPLAAGTWHLVNAERLAQLRPGSLIVNASRGPLVDEAALIEALRSGHLGGAALDVFETEPLPAGSPLRSLDNVFVTPHIAGDSIESRLRLIDVVTDNIQRVLAGQPPEHVVNRTQLNTRTEGRSSDATRTLAN